MTLLQKSLLLILTISVQVSTSFAGNIRLSPASLSYDDSFTNKTDSLRFQLSNEGTDTVRITDINTFQDAFFARDTQFVLAPDDTVKVWMYFASKHNLTYNDIAVIENSDTAGSVVLRLAGTKKYPDTYYQSTQGLSGEPLKTALKALVTNHTVRSYDAIRDQIFLQVDPENNELECVYTGRKIPVTNRSQMQSTGQFNTEHTFPQGFFNSASPMVSDINHLFPTWETANGRRSNYPFGIVVGTPTWQDGGSKLGKSSWNQTVFEPRDSHKGDVARALLYFMIRYQDYGNFWAGGGGAPQEMHFRNWNAQDPPSPKEKTRNERIASPSVQGKRNPFIDHPELVDRISKFNATIVATTAPRIAASPRSLDLGGVAVGGSMTWKLAIVNSGSAALTISGVSSSNAVFTVKTFPASVPANSVGYAEVVFTPAAVQTVYTGTFTINSNDAALASLQVAVSGEGTTLTGVAEVDSSVPADYSLGQNYPNPFNPATTISFVFNKPTSAALQVYDILGRQVATLFEGKLEAGQHTTTWDAGNLPGGVYFYRLTTPEFTGGKKMILAK